LRFKGKKFKGQLIFILGNELLVELLRIDVLDVIKKRRSIRTYKKQDLPQETIETLLEAARWALSAGNVQTWEFVVITSEKMKQELRLAAYGQKNLEEASIVIVVCVDEKRAEQSYGSRGKTLCCLQDTAAAVQNILLTAFSLGLCSYWLGAFKEDQIKKVVKSPEVIRQVALITIGYSNEAPTARSRRPIDEIMHREVF
jgi:nitroreductase